MTTIVVNDYEREWVDAMHYLNNNDPVWYSSQDDLEFVDQYRQEICNIINDVIRHFDDYTTSEQDTVLRYANFVDLLPSIETLLLDAPDKLEKVPLVDSSEERVRGILPIVKDALALQWIIEHYPLKSKNSRSFSKFYYTTCKG